jgi:hypothetical protein
MGDAEAEDLAAQRPQPRGLHFQPDDEQQHDDAEFGGVEDVFGVGEEPETERADGESRCEIAEHRAEAEAAKDRHRDDACAEQSDNLYELFALAFYGHTAPASS